MASPARYVVVRIDTVGSQSLVNKSAFKETYNGISQLGCSLYLLNSAPYVWVLGHHLTLSIYSLLPISFLFAQLPDRRRFSAHTTQFVLPKFGTLSLSARRLVRISFAPGSIPSDHLLNFEASADFACYVGRCSLWPDRRSTDAARNQK